MLNFLDRFNVKLKLLLILIIYLILAVTYSIVVPIGGGADEWAHFWYTQFIADNQRLPTSIAERDMAGYKSDWPPLYHIFAAGLTASIETDGAPVFKYRPGNTCACAVDTNIRRELAAGTGSSAILHTEDELFPWRQEILVWHLGRFLSIGFTLGTLLITYFIAKEVFVDSSIGKGKQVANPKTLALIAVAVLAFSPRFLFTGMLFSYDGLTLFLATLFLWVVIRVAKGRNLSWGFWILGALAGLALMTKYLAAFLPVEIVVLAFLVSRAEGRQGNGLWLRSLVVRLGQAALAYVFIVGWWFGYLLINFNEISTYGPLLGTLAPLLRGDGSDRTVEELFAWLSGGQAPPPAYIEKQIYTAWQVIAEFPTTFWGNAITRPYPLNWFIIAMTLVMVVAAIGLIIWYRASVAAKSPVNAKSRFQTRLFGLLVLFCLLPVPFMIVRLFGARDALEAVQGRHILFLAGSAVAVLLVWGLNVIKCQMPSIKKFLFPAVLGLLLTGVMSQLIFMWNIYPPFLPVQTTLYAVAQADALPHITLADQAELIDMRVGDNNRQSLQVDLMWQVTDDPFYEDYQVELALVDAGGQIWSNWRAYQTQARYPNRVWQAGDTVRDEGWLPLVGLPVGDYDLQMRIFSQEDEIVPWQILTNYTLSRPVLTDNDQQPWTLWQEGDIAYRLPSFGERETIQFTFAGSADSRLVGSDGVPRQAVSVGPTWANFIVDPSWPPGDYHFEFGEDIVLQVEPNGRNFQVPAELSQLLEANFAGQTKLLGYHLPIRRVQPGDGLPVTLYWQGLQWSGEDFVIFNRLLDNQQVAWGGYDRLPQEDYSTLLWVPGEIVTDGFAVPVASDAPDGIYTLNLGWYRLVDGEAESLVILNPETGETTTETSVTLGPIKVGGAPPGITVATATPETDVNVTLGEQIALLGFDANQGNSTIDFTFYWQALTQPGTDYTVFVHIRDAADEVVAQRDSPPAGGSYPTGLWDQGEIIKDEITVSIDGVEPGEYEVVIGMYDFDTGLRLPIEGSSDGTISLQSLEVSK